MKDCCCAEGAAFVDWEEPPEGFFELHSFGTEVWDCEATLGEDCRAEDGCYDWLEGVS